MALASFRPIVLSSCLGKIMDRVMHARIEWFVEQNDLYTEMVS